MEKEILMQIINKLVGSIDTSQNEYENSIQKLKTYEYIVNCILEDFIKYAPLYQSGFYSDKQVGEEANRYLLELTQWLREEQDFR